LETFCDRVFAIALTLLIIDIKAPAPEGIAGTPELWRALQHLLPSVFAFVLSFAIILITWLNHHNVLRLIQRSSSAFVYANGFLLLTVVFTPFPTALLGEFLFTDHAAPAVLLYNAVLAVSAIGWILIGEAALKGRLTSGEHATTLVREATRNGYFAFVLYALLAVTAVWYPFSVAVVTTASWVFWLVLSIRMKH
jgi:TMEM175 potassium channel family protein